MSTFTIRQARPEDWSDVRALLLACALPLAGVDETLAGFFVTRDEQGMLLACAALQRYGRSGLLRSVAATPARRGEHLVSDLIRLLMERAASEGLTDITLLTTTAAGYFPRYGFRAIPRDDAPAAIRASVEFRDVCPDTATVMTLALG